MDLRRGFTLFIFTVVLAGTLGVKIQRMTPFAVGVVGSAVHLNCSVTEFSTQNAVLEWRTPGGQRIFSTHFAGKPLDGFMIEYLTDPLSGVTHFDLIITRMLPNMTGTYVFRVGSSTGEQDHSVNTVAVEKLSCHPAAGAVEVVEGERVALTCAAAFYGDVIPDVKWKHGITWETIPASNLSVVNEAVYAVNLTADGSHDETPAVCQLSFPYVEGASYYLDTCRTHFNVIHPPQNIQFMPDLSQPESQIIYVGDTVNCSATGRPEPDVYWLTSSGVVYEYSSMLTVSRTMAGQQNEFVCLARTTYNGFEYKSEKSVKFYADYHPVGQASKNTLQLAVYSLSILCLWRSLNS